MCIPEIETKLKGFSTFQTQAFAIIPVLGRGEFGAGVGFSLQVLFLCEMSCLAPSLWEADKKRLRWQSLTQLGDLEPYLYFGGPHSNSTLSYHVNLLSSRFDDPIRMGTIIGEYQTLVSLFRNIFVLVGYFVFLKPDE